MLDHNRGATDASAKALNMPYGIAVHDGGLICADTANSRLVGYPLDALCMDAAASTLAGQQDFSRRGDNRWRFAARDSVCWPFAVASCGDCLAIADTSSKCVLLRRVAR